MIFLIIGLILGGITVIFISQNIVPVSVLLFGWEIHASLSIVLIASILIGALIATLSCISEMIESSAKISNLEKYIKTLGEENVVLKKRINDGIIL